VLLVHLPNGRGTELVRDALVDTVQTMPAHLKRSLTWDQGSEMGRHHEFTVATDIPVYFCDPAGPWQRGSNENTNGLLRQYFPTCMGAAVFVIGLAAVTYRRMPGRLTRVLPAARRGWLSLGVSTRPVSVRGLTQQRHEHRPPHVCRSRDVSCGFH
jgi:hypothetical protein